MRRALWVIVAACGAPPKPLPPPPIPPSTPVAREHYVFRQRHLGASSSHRTTFELAFDGDRATLRETDERSADLASWTIAATRTYRGTRHGADVSLTTDGMQPLAMHCERRPLDVAAPGDDCSARDRHVDVLVCSAPGQTDVTEPDGDDAFAFAVPPGVEWLEVACGAGLHQLR